MKKPRQIFLDNKEINPEIEPKADIAICSECGWRGAVEKCTKGQEGDWESGYYEIDECPVCEDGGWISDYDMSPQRFKEWEQWVKIHPKRNTVSD